MVTSAFKYQSVTAPNGVIANFYGPLEGSRHDSYLLAVSGVLDSLGQHSLAPDGSPLCIYGDPAYPLSIHLQTGHQFPSSPAQASAPWLHLPEKFFKNKVSSCPENTLPEY